MKGIQIKNEEFFVKVKNFKLHVNLMGKKTNKSTLVMDAGYGDYSAVWKEIAPEIAKITEVVLYDRAGLGETVLLNERGLFFKRNYPFSYNLSNYCN